MQLAIIELNAKELQIKQENAELLKVGDVFAM
jgi:hypothetical protein